MVIAVTGDGGVRSNDESHSVKIGRRQTVKACQNRDRMRDLGMLANAKGRCRYELGSNEGVGLC